MKKYILNLRPYIGPKELTQVSAVDWLARYQNIENKDEFHRYAVKTDHISSRAIYADGIGGEFLRDGDLYSLQEKSNPDLSKRSESAQKMVVDIFNSLYDGEQKSPNHLCHVSCTHYQSPSAAQKIVLDKKWQSDTIVTHLYHMGCYASLPAIRVSKAYISDGAEQVDIVHTELCSFHLNKEDRSTEQIVMNTLFADGAIKYSVTNETYFKAQKQNGFEIIAHKEELVLNSENEMSWKLGSHGFLMTLTKKVPVFIAKGIEKYMRTLFIDAGLDFDKNKGKVIFAIHPGGPKIIELIAKVLKLDDFQIKHSLAVLKRRGNMSSATIPHVWNEILQDEHTQTEQYVVTVAFGPGLTITGAILKICK